MAAAQYIHAAFIMWMDKTGALHEDVNADITDTILTDARKYTQLYLMATKWGSENFKDAEDRELYAAVAEVTQQAIDLLDHLRPYIKAAYRQAERKNEKPFTMYELLKYKKGPDPDTESNEYAGSLDQDGGNWLSGTILGQCFVHGLQQLNRQKVNPFPTSVFTENMFKGFRMGAGGLADIRTLSAGSATTTISGPDIVQKSDFPNMRTVTTKRQKKLNTYEAGFVIPDVSGLARASKAQKKWLMFILQKMAGRAIDDKGNLVSDHIDFNLQELVDAGMYSSISNARRGWETFRQMDISKFSMSGYIQRGKKRQACSGPLFDLATEPDNNVCTVYLNDKFDWAVIWMQYGYLPVFYYDLNDNAADLLHYVCYIARMNTADIKKQGYIVTSLQSIKEYLRLTGRDRDIMKAIDTAIGEIEDAQPCAADTQFRFSLIYDSDNGATEKLAHGKLQVAISGDIKGRYVQLEKDKQKRISDAKKRRAKEKEREVEKQQSAQK